MAGKKRPCKYGASCYRKNEQHFDQFSHPEEEYTDPPSKKLRPSLELAEQSSQSSPELGYEHESDDEISKETSSLKERKGVMESHQDSEQEKHQVEKEEEEEEEDERSTIKRKFLVEMPEDFYHFWEFCKSLKPTQPQLALKDPLGLELVGPYDVLAGRLRGVPMERCLLHMRHFYDTPEVLTVLKAVNEDEEDGYHIGYYRDDPNTTECFLVANSPGKSCEMTAMGLNIFTAVRYYVMKQQTSAATKKASLQTLLKKLVTCSAQNGLDTMLKQPKGRKPVASCFNKIGMCVPVDKALDVGYRPLPMTNRQLRILLEKISSLQDPSHARDVASEPLQEMMTLVQFANDECDYGMGLELGTDLFCFGDQFHSMVLHLLPLAYQLLGREQYSVIIKEHIEHRSKTPLDYRSTHS